MATRIAVIVQGDEVKVYCSDPEAHAIVLNARALIDEQMLTKEQLMEDVAAATDGLTWVH
jgi:hypothetical protein